MKRGTKKIQPSIEKPAIMNMRRSRSEKSPCFPEDTN